jgi:hypothetical protein
MRHKRTQVAKSKLDEALMRGESWAIMFTLKNKVDPDAEFVGEKHALDLTSGGEKLQVPQVIEVIKTYEKNEQ